MAEKIHKHIYIKPENEYLLPLIKAEAKRLKISESDVIVRAVKIFLEGENSE